MEKQNLWTDIFSNRETKEKYKSFVNKRDKQISSLLEFDPDRTSGDSASGGILKGIPFVVKDNIAVKSFRLTCGSRILENFISPYTATGVERLQKEGAVVIGKANLDEFGMGSSNENSAFGETANPWDLSRVPGGSSGGSAAAVAAGIAPFALGSDTGGSVRQPASFCGVYGLKPSYGLVSRYGLTAYASSLEVIGVVSADIPLLRKVFDTMKGRDPMDQTSMDPLPLKKKAGSMKIGILKGKLELREEVRKSYLQTIEELKNAGHEVIDIELTTMKYVVPAYYTIAAAEASANLARYNGIKYGYRSPGSENHEHLVKTSRHEGFGDEVKLRILLGTYVLRSGFQDQYYLRAQKIRTAIKNDFDRAFSTVDIIMMPVFPTTAFKRGDGGLDQFQQKLADRFTCSANLAGIPALAFPVGMENGLPVGMQFVAPYSGEELLFKAAEDYAKIFKPILPEESKGWE